MAKEKFARTKPHCNIGTIGHVDHGKTSLTAAITKVLAEDRGRDLYGLRPDRQGAGREGPWHHHLDRARRVRDKRNRHYAHVDCPRPRRLREEHDHPAPRRWTGRSSSSPPPTARCRRPASISCSPARSACRRSSCS